MSLGRDLDDNHQDSLGTDFFDGSQDDFTLDNQEGPEGSEDLEFFVQDSGPEDIEVLKDQESAKKEDILKTFPSLGSREHLFKTIGEYHNDKNQEPSENSARSVPSFAWEDILQTIASSDPRKSIARWMVKVLRSGREMHCLVLRNFEWSSWAPCSRSCGGGLRSRGRDRLRKREIEKEICNSFSCPPTMSTSPQPCKDTGCSSAFNGSGKCVHLKGNFLEGIEKFDPNVTPIYGICSSACDCACMKLRDQQNATEAITTTRTTLLPAASTMETSVSKTTTTEYDKTSVTTNNSSADIQITTTPTTTTATATKTTTTTTATKTATTTTTTTTTTTKTTATMTITQQ